MVAATIRTIFAQPSAELVRSQLDTVADMLGRQFPRVRQMLIDAKEDLTAFADFPDRHWKKIQSTNPLERINREVKRRADVVQVFPNSSALERLTTAVPLRDARRMDRLPPPLPPRGQHGRDLPRGTRAHRTPHPAA
jgi:putative transposase